MKRNLSIFCIALLIVSLVIGVAFATDALEIPEFFTASDAGVSSDVSVVTSDVSVSSAETVVLSNAVIHSDESEFEISSPSDNLSAQKLDTLASFVSNFDVKNLTYEDYVTIESYINFNLTHSLNSDESNQIIELIKDGTPMGTIWDIYEFYLTTNEDFSIIARIASYEERYWGKYWIENAYNDITANKHGVIEREQTASYLERFNTNEILYANVLSRKGIYTIDEILDEHYDGTSWNDITHEIYSRIQLDSLTGSMKERQSIAEYLGNEVFDYDSSPYEVYNLAFFCAKNKIELEEGLVNKETIPLYSQQAMESADELLLELSAKISKHLNLPEEYMSEEKLLEYSKTNYQKAIEKGIDEKTIDILLDKGLTMGEIAEGIVEGENHVSIMQHIKSQRGDILK